MPEKPIERMAAECGKFKFGETEASSPTGETRQLVFQISKARPRSPLGAASCLPHSRLTLVIFRAGNAET
jgi:hypothetical protein